MLLACTGAAGADGDLKVALEDDPSLTLLPNDLNFAYLAFMCAQMQQALAKSPWSPSALFSTGLNFAYLCAGAASAGGDLEATVEDNQSLTLLLLLSN